MKTERQKREDREEQNRQEAFREAVLDAAQAQVDEGFEVDPDAVVSMCDTGAYVQGWVYVDSDDVEVPGDDGWPQDCPNPVSVEEMEEAVKMLLQEITSGRTYESKNPYLRDCVVKAMTLLAHRQGIDLVENPSAYLGAKID